MRFRINRTNINIACWISGTACLVFTLASGTALFRGANQIDPLLLADETLELSLFEDQHDFLSVGSWVVADQPFGISSTSLAFSEADARWEKELNKPFRRNLNLESKSEFDVKLDRSLVPIQPEIWDFIKHFRPRKVGENITWYIETKPGLRIGVLVDSGQIEPRLIAAYLFISDEDFDAAIQLGTEQPMVRFIEVFPVSSNPAFESQLPAAMLGQRLAYRLPEGGIAGAEIHQLSIRQLSQIEQWLPLTGWVELAEFSFETVNATSYRLFQRGTDVLTLAVRPASSHNGQIVFSSLTRHP